MENPAKDVTPTKEDRMDDPADVGVDTAQARDADDKKVTTTLMEGGEGV